MAHLASQAAVQKSETILGKLLPTAANTACREIYGRNGFNQTAENPILWSRPLALPLRAPAHVRLAGFSEVERGR